MSAVKFNKIGIIGLGLIGGSIALALKQQAKQTNPNATPHIVAFDSDSECLQYAKAHGIIDTIAIAPSDCAACELIFIAIPVQSYPQLFADMKNWLQPHTLVTDTGSTKRNIIAAARQHLTDAQCQQFVPAHPIAGKENSNLAAAAADLFENCKVVLCADFNNTTALETVSHFWQQHAAHPMLMDSEQHDKIFSLVSHLPHLLSYALVNVINEHTDSNTLTNFMAGGFYDFTRIASSHPTMWSDIATANGDHISDALQLMQDEFSALLTAIANNDNAALHQRFATAKAARDTWLANKTK